MNVAIKISQFTAVRRTTMTMKITEISHKISFPVYLDVIFKSTLNTEFSDSTATICILHKEVERRVYWLANAHISWTCI